MITEDEKKGERKKDGTKGTQSKFEYIQCIHTLKCKHGLLVSHKISVK